MASERRVLVVGGGIGGLSAAVALRRSGFAVTVLEQARELQELGAGITIWSNAVRALARLGLGPDMDRIGMPATLRTIRTWRGDTLSRIDVAGLARGLGAAILIVRRSDLQQALFEHLGRDHVRLGCRCVDVAQDGAGVTVRLEDGSEERCDVLVGADGIRSAVRASLFGDRPLRYSGYTSWRGVASFHDEGIAAGVSSETWGLGRRFGLLPMRDGTYWFACRNGPAGQGLDAGSEDHRRQIRELFRGWHRPIEEVIEATASPIIRTDIHDVEPLSRWGIGRVTLLGDAAHAMTPNMGQGGCQAIEDAVVLGDSLAASADMVAGLRAYEARRIGRANGIVRWSWRIGWVSQLDGALTCWGRNLLVRHVLRHVLARQVEGIVGYVV
jgi:2-polyprenyl-6-methoxyphenol hydroxylase-like FAD-dependent oxidoreductase